MDKAGMYRLFRQVNNGELFYVTSRDSFDAAIGQLEAFNLQWPGCYVILSPDGCAVGTGAKAAGLAPPTPVPRTAPSYAWSEVRLHNENKK